MAPMMMCWEIWKERKTCKFVEQMKMFDKKLNIVPFGTSKLLSKLPIPNITRNWPSICRNIEILKPKVAIQPIISQKPEIRNYKINDDGSYMENGSVRIVGILRCSKGYFIFAFSWSI
ncbi:hypothetical protein H5410_061470 [Solanum commersonii]|uniref:Uncharacterized protein n=1 Tax=Solanum commersonii TaxID=4109 RepID=A0A9J5W8Q4_SOLCO|nr:hypothetical protein H5410_061469 [Solanum commersonii]KAG5571704.1 hypothetical protein H5410_061470 [Solanum commersonii]